MIIIVIAFILAVIIVFLNTLRNESKQIPEPLPQPTTTHPKGVWIWQIAKLRPDYINKLQAQGCKRVFLKVADGETFWSDQCNKKIIDKFVENGIEVFAWSYIYGKESVKSQVEIVENAKLFGCKAFVFDVEAELKDANRHEQLKQILIKTKEILPLGFTSFGNSKFHPEIPWAILDEHCAYHFPQIYFELFNFDTDEKEVAACVDSFKGFKSKLMPVFSSEHGVKTPAPLQQVQSFMNRFEGASLWRLPHVGEGGHGFDIDYGIEKQPVSIPVGEVKLQVLKKALQRGDSGISVLAIQRYLNSIGLFSGEMSGDYDEKTEQAVKLFQAKNGIEQTGRVGRQTYKAMGGEFEETEGTMSEKLILFAEQEALKALVWDGAQSEAEKYLRPFRKPMQDLGQIGSEPVFFNWCAAFVYYCCKEVGMIIPIKDPKFWATMALVDSWIFWAKKNAKWHPVGSVIPRRGMIVIFDWHKDGLPDHIGLVRNYKDGIVYTVEGNKNNKSGCYERYIENCYGFIELI